MLASIYREIMGAPLVSKFSNCIIVRYKRKSITWTYRNGYLSHVVYSSEEKLVLEFNNSDGKFYKLNYDLWKDNLVELFNAFEKNPRTGFFEEEAIEDFIVVNEEIAY